MSDTPVRYPPIPYGRGNFRSVRLDRCLYVDKTRFIRILEQERFVFFIRPRRFGKTLWLTMLNAYYNRTQAKDFDAVFAGTDIGREPTGNRSRYVVLYLDFSAFKQALPTLEESFDEHCTLHVDHALRRNRDLFDEDAARTILAPPSINGKLQALFLYAIDHDIPLYVLIDEYDNFANTILAHRGAEAYHSFTHGEGFFRNFFGTLKAGTAESGAIERLFVTGVSPITMDDVTSGFNIGANVSLRPGFNEVLGFTEAEVRDMLRMYRDRGAIDQDPDAVLDLMREWYDGYRFAEEAGPDIYNTDMVLYYLRESIANGTPPRELIDSNIRIDYGKLRHLLLVNRQASARQRHEDARQEDVPAYVPTGEAELNGNFDLLRQVVAEERVDVHIRDSFPLKRLTERESFLSLLHYFGLLSIRAMVEGRPRLGIPNQTVKRLLFGHLREAFEDIGAFTADLYALEQRIHEMAYRGAWRPVFDHLADAVARQTGGARLHRGGEGAARVPGRLPGDHGAFRVPLRARARRGLCRHLPGAEPGELRGHAPRLRGRAQVRQARRAAGAGDRGGGGGGGDAAPPLPVRRNAGAGVSHGAVHRSGAGVPRLGAGAGGGRRCAAEGKLKASVPSNFRQRPGHGDVAGISSAEVEDPQAGFGAIVRFAGLDWDGARLARAVAHAAFHRLRAQEEESGFADKQPTAPSFFRAGVAGSWRSVLSARQVRALVDTHGTIMERLGYLREAEAFLASRGSAGAPAA